MNAKFEVSTTICGEVIARSIFVAWELVSSLKTAKGVIFERVSTSYLFQRIKSPIFPNFHAGIIICIIFVISSLTIERELYNILFEPSSHIPAVCGWAIVLKTHLHLQFLLQFLVGMFGVHH